MARTDRSDFFLQSRRRYPWFLFDRQEYQVTGEGLEVTFTFSLAGEHTFRPRILIPAGPAVSLTRMNRSDLENIIFHIGMVEMISYWKAACPPRVIIRPATLEPAQSDWWRHLFFHGLGEFLYLNSIDISEEELVTIEAGAGPSLSVRRYDLDDQVIVPVGGGKDSAVTLEILRNHTLCHPLIMNPRQASLGTIKAGGFRPDSLISIRRTLDPELLNLNSRGFLNGHTPFSALLAFVTVLSAIVSGHRHIALSNESSANEATIGGTTINHQYSKSFRFESLFRDYVRQWISPDVNYFSFLRPLNELTIARLFAGMPAYHSVFRSCNAGSKTDSWCGRCAKCLFTYTILAPFLAESELSGIFGKDLFADPSLANELDQLTGVAGEKPFDCVGTVDEVNLALCETVRHREGTALPALLARYRNSSAYRRYSGFPFPEGPGSLTSDHHLPGAFEGWLRYGLNNVCR